MAEHFRAFSFVDRITAVRDGQQILGSYTVPSQPGGFPLSLVGEAIGQLAAWAAMAAVDFHQRPVAGLAGGIELLHEPRPGQLLQLSVDLEHVDDQSVEYRGTACADGQPVLRLQDCVGPMVPLVEFDDPQLLRNRFAELRQNGALPGGFPGLPNLPLTRTNGPDARSVSATFNVPANAAFFADHFPRRPVFPGSLLMHVQLQLGSLLARQIPPPATGRWLPSMVQDMKLRSFIPPGATLQLEAKLKQPSGEAATLTLETRMATELIATARLLLKPEAGV
jgi:3-hydroxymyristoyl/3-hydroxydecanoyl-(acyl carrier protein) dehydratase